MNKYEHYNFKSIEKKWSNKWLEDKVYKTSTDSSKPKFYILDMFPYPSGAGLHLGHIRGYTATDIIARYKRLNGYNVLHPMGWDAFGLPTERASIRENKDPHIITKENTINFKKQINMVGFSYDWDKEFKTTDFEYYKWTQYIFIQMYNKELAYLDEIEVNWCSNLNTVLANEEVLDGLYIETGDKVIKKKMRQWVLAITKYSDKLLEDLSTIDWPDSIKSLQRNWIGKSIGYEIQFSIKGLYDRLNIFTTKPETIYGVTYCAISHLHPKIDILVRDKYKQDLKNYIDNYSEDYNELDGFFTGSYVINPLSNEEIPVWVSSYVISTYGLGSVMCVPAHDIRDHGFASKFGLKIKNVFIGKNITNEYNKEYIELSDSLVSCNTPSKNNLPLQYVKSYIIKKLLDKKVATSSVKYKLRDWVFSRQRYWGEPVPMIHYDDKITPDPNNCVVLPELNRSKPSKNKFMYPLENADDLWKYPEHGGKKGVRDFNTMPQWAASCWYYLYFLRNINDIKPGFEDKPWTKANESYWMPVDLYIGGSEHAVLHLLYARFWHKVLYDLGWVSTTEPFKRLFNQGMLLYRSYKDSNGKFYKETDTIKKGNNYYLKSDPSVILKSKIEKMSKSKYNVINPESIIDKYGADTLRMYEMFIGPLSSNIPWCNTGIEGVHRFLNKVWTMFITKEGISPKIKDVKPNQEINLSFNILVKDISYSIESIDKLNTGVSSLMIFVNKFYKEKEYSLSIVKEFLVILSVYAPHIAEEIWFRLGLYKVEGYIYSSSWPKYNKKILDSQKKLVIVQINNRTKCKVNVDVNISNTELREYILNLEDIKVYNIENKIKRMILTNKLVNILI